MRVLIDTNVILDAVLHEAGVAMGVGSIVTRDVHGFLKSTIPVYTSDEFVAVYY